MTVTKGKEAHIAFHSAAAEEVRGHRSVSHRAQKSCLASPPRRWLVRKGGVGNRRIDDSEGREGLREGRRTEERRRKGKGGESDSLTGEQREVKIRG